MSHAEDSQTRKDHVLLVDSSGANPDEQLAGCRNILGGHSGEIELSNHLNLGGKKISNVAPGEGATDVLTSEVAEAKYSAAALQPQLQAGSKTPLGTYRMLNSGTQREQTSSWLNDLLSTPPNSNTINPIVSSSRRIYIRNHPGKHCADGGWNKTVLAFTNRHVDKPGKLFRITTFTVSAGVATVNVVDLLHRPR